ncbi:hypothetical protein RHGRI_020573 [Rhododendron griersonianum]|uniref:Uncharacterized protein n=1 Tax=Rhododendron griersonianum TaxID=479676 RepID=A0AAV6JMF1_9ERIC|nr:hypothetical protein RHGRI_020573 [Rhododendron griersonianum]
MIVTWLRPVMFPNLGREALSEVLHARAQSIIADDGASFSSKEQLVSAIEKFEGELARTMVEMDGKLKFQGSEAESWLEKLKVGFLRYGIGHTVSRGLFVFRTTIADLVSGTWKMNRVENAFVVVAVNETEMKTVCWDFMINWDCLGCTIDKGGL